MLRCEECVWFYCTPFTQRRLCRMTFQEVVTDKSLLAETCKRFECRVAVRKERRSQVHTA